MSEEQLKAFIAKVQGDAKLQDKLKAAKSTEDVVSIAKDHGHEFTADKISQLSEEELEGVAGGTIDTRYEYWFHAEPTHQSPCNGRGFYFFNHPIPTINQTQIASDTWHDWAQ